MKQKRPLFLKIFAIALVLPLGFGLFAQDDAQTRARDFRDALNKDDKDTIKERLNKMDPNWREKRDDWRNMEGTREDKLKKLQDDASAALKTVDLNKLTPEEAAEVKASQIRAKLKPLKNEINKARELGLEKAWLEEMELDITGQILQETPEEETMSEQEFDTLLNRFQIN